MFILKKGLLGLLGLLELRTKLPFILHEKNLEALAGNIDSHVISALHALTALEVVAVGSGHSGGEGIDNIGVAEIFEVVGRG